ncbi:unnamed protein product [Protopolystoma xenopodis]|uniref:Uncharacterized protein n=1 Tax=Protopolystoma xenopodis TaxID=117903 RepID=A0A3S5B123_9PLAT|nr:unnamed protein product [Protopolystoma xenopodis]
MRLYYSVKPIWEASLRTYLKRHVRRKHPRNSGGPSNTPGEMTSKQMRQAMEQLFPHLKPLSLSEETRTVRASQKSSEKSILPLGHLSVISEFEVIYNSCSLTFIIL